MDTAGNFNPTVFYERKNLMQDPNSTTTEIKYDVHAPCDSTGYSPVIATVIAPDIQSAVTIAQETYENAHPVGQGGEGPYVIQSHH